MALSLLAFAAFAVADWIAVGKGWRRLEYAAKPAALAALLVYAAAGTHHSAWLLAALVFSLLGDVFLMLPVDVFAAGVAAFLLAHVAYIVEIEAPFGARVAWLAGILIVCSPLALRVLRAVPAGALRAAVAVYLAVISFMVASTFAWGYGLPVLGALLFLASDTFIAWDRFVGRVAWARPVIMVTYHLGQLGLATALR